MKIPKSMAPSMRLMIFSEPKPNKVEFKPRSIRRIVTPIFNGRSFLIALREIFIGQTKADAPKISNVLKMFDPTTFPIAMSALPCTAERKLTTISGVDVPIPTIVRPITNSLNPKRLAMLEEPSTR